MIKPRNLLVQWGLLCEVVGNLLCYLNGAMLLAVPWAVVGGYNSMTAQYLMGVFN